MRRGHKRVFIAVFFRQSLTAHPQILTKAFYGLKILFSIRQQKTVNASKDIPKSAKKNKDRREKKFRKCSYPLGDSASLPGPQNSI